ncbi:MAG: DEAD/DEAH box helicase [Nitrososphaerota archaeon]|nr:DEAD/DEAH box helicase [Nitrososphaerota archaeon]MDG6903360.1 DEAD/DEAH box helicase [Nitrososphaerota archaeon]MDG6911778.1 DEAD/DEAH box helicase [Nitrososphaerota archaeon]MDG6940740.1 DEAD/DEAH box helicase [Nitrososphaerota archaeon]MDG6945655.1 DEAD/DEAH box helicase [Nitrososphaerota archaeon]
MPAQSAFEALAPAVRGFLADTGMVEPTPPQVEAWPLVSRGADVLVVAPTGSGKTEAAILPLLSRLVSEGHGDGISLLYITPMRALNRDMQRRLQAWCTRLGLTVDIRHGDTPQSQRAKQSSHPPDVMVTTPETLQAILPGRRMRDNLSPLKAVVVDELHNLVESKRGVQLCVGLERLRKVAPKFQLVALSATIGTPAVAAKFLFGEREVKIVKADAPKEFAYAIEYPVPDPASQSAAKETYSAPDLAARLARINSLIDGHVSTLIFVNSRTLAEMLGEKLARLRKDVGVHHGSLPREERERVEQAFKAGELKALVCTSTLELGIDVGSVDLVVQYMSPRQVTSLVQRVGRSGHRLGKVSKGVLVTVSADDILESSASIRSAAQRKIEPTRPYSNSLDVLAHQVAGYLMDFETMEADTMLTEVRKAEPFESLSDDSFLRTVSFLAELRKLRFDGKTLSRTRLTREYYYENLSMIPDETRYLVVDVSTNQTVGILGEEFVLLKARVGIHFVIKGRVWQVEQIADDRKIYVTPVEDPLAAVPGWDGEMLPIPYELAKDTGRLRREVSEALDAGQDAVETVEVHIPGDAAARALVVDQIAEQKKMGAPVPSDRLVLFEGFGRYLVVHLCFGESINRTFAYVFEEILSKKGLVRVWWLDGYRLLMELTVETEELDLKAIARGLMGMAPDEFERTYAVAAQRNFPFPARVKFVAERFGALRRGKLIAHPNLCSLPTRFEKTPIFEEALQETGRDLIDMEHSKEILVAVADGEVSVETFMAGERPTPIAYSLLYRYLEVPEAVAPDSLGKSSYQRMKTTIFGASVSLLCVKCGGDQGETTVGEVPDEPRCRNCGSGLLAPCYWGTAKLSELVKRREAKAQLNEEERSELSRARRGADLVLSYGKKAVVAQTVYGVGPQTASRILAEMHDDEEAFYRDLLEAKIRFVTTRQYWGS